MSQPPKIIDKYGIESFGGSQMWLPDKMLLNSGCGIIAGLDAIMRLKGEERMPREEYFDRFFDAKDYIRPITIGSLGVSAGRFRRGIKKLAAKEGLKIRVKPFRFKWWEKVPKYLEGGDPLVMLVTAPFENVSIELPTGTKGNLGFHWVTITEMDGDTLWVSSWGTRCKMSVKELRRFNVILHFYAVSLENQTNIV